MYKKPRIYLQRRDCNGVEVCIKIVNIFVPIKRKCAQGSPLAFIRKELKISTRSSLINNFSIKKKKKSTSNSVFEEMLKISITET